MGRTKITMAAVDAFLKAHDEDTTDLFRVEFGTENMTLWKYRRYTTGPNKGELMMDRRDGGGRPQTQIERKAYS
jgi:hypothetical protein